ncbi:MAG: Ig-like domain-containing protein, partial [Candidatus Limnocylindrales bacterium]
MSATAEGPSGQPPVRRGALATLLVLGATALIVVGAVIGFGPRGIIAPSSTPGASSTPNPSAAADWTALGTLDPLTPLATLNPTTSDAAGIAADTSFTLASLTSTSAAALAAGLTVEPAVALRVAPAADPAKVVVSPAAPLDPGRRYRFKLLTPDGALAGQWLYQVKAPIHVVTALPGDRSTDVPLASGIELTFDQDGVIDAAAHFAIDPAVPGRFETHGRTLVFVPTTLAPATLYTVTLSAGIGMTGSDAHLEQDVRIRFETVIGTTASEEPFVVLGRAMTEVAPDERAVISLEVDQPQDENGTPIGAPVTSLPVEVYRLPDHAAAAKAARIVLDAPDWARTPAGLVPTAGLTRVMSFDGKIQTATGGTQ